MYDVAFYEVFREEQDRLKSILPPTLKVQYHPETVQEADESAPISRIICIRTQSVIPADWYGTIDAVLTRSQGYDHLTRMFAGSNARVSLGYLGDYCSYSVAEHAVFSVISLLRQFKRQYLHFQTFNRDDLTGYECPGKRVLVVGVGHIGRQVVKMAQALGMEVRGVDISPQTDMCEYVGLEDGLSWANIVVCALPLTDLTHGMLGYERIKNSGSLMCLVNISRGEITPLEDMRRLLDEGILNGLAMDVFEQEGVLADGLRAGHMRHTWIETAAKLSQRDNVLFTPHNAFNTIEGLARKTRATVDSIQHFLTQGSFLHSLQIS